MKYLYLLLLILIFSACSVFQSSNETNDSSTSDSSDEVYVFDDVSDEEAKAEEIKKVTDELKETVEKNKDTEESVFDDVEPSETVSELNSSPKFFIQVGAFSTLARAEQFVNEVKSQAPFELSVIYKASTSLYTVRSKAINSREEADKIKEDLWSKNLFKDAFIVTE